MTVVTATGLEYAQARRALGERARVVRAGIALRNGSRIDGTAISCGLAGGLRTGVATGTVLIPSRIRRADGSALICDSEWTQKLREAAKKLRLTVDTGDLITLPHIVRGEQRAKLAAEGCVGVDMESAAIDAARIACVRVVLDTPEREISPAWLNGLQAAVTPAAWIDLPFLAKNGPRCARTAARVVAEALR